DIEVEGFHTETGPGVYEAAIRYDQMLRGADKAALFKTAVKEICARHAVMPTFMAKWSKELPGCSGHLHQSLWTLDGHPLGLDARGVPICRRRHEPVHRHRRLGRGRAPRCAARDGAPARDGG